MARSFSFSNAAFHAGRADGPSGFLWAYLLVYAVFAVLVAVVQYGLQALLLRSEIDMQVAMAGGGFTSGMIGKFALFYLITIAISVVIWSVLEASIMRRYVHETGFTIGFGGDERRLIMVGLAWVATFIGLYILSAIAAFVVTGGIGSLAQGSPVLLGVAAFIVGLALTCVWIFVTVRLSAASALTIRDKKVHFFDSWGATKGRFWPLFGAYLLLSVIIFIVGIVMIGVLVALIGIDMPRPEVLLAHMSPAGLGLAFFGFFGVMTILQGLMSYIWAGPASLAAKTDPRGAGMVGAADVFS